ncbi:unnamed protein product [Ilex paraguariensis]|uniref:Translation initiation factor 3 N-terminal domain-containing protein n=1 Tax=Ilex paraguariensis TaxID=185542 RepID=A0ABC8SFW5_9AQUA
MAFWCRVKQLQLNRLSNQFKRCYFQTYGPCSVDRRASYSKICVLNRPNWFIYRPQNGLPTNVRFFAAPVQTKPKQEEKDTSGPRLNEQIKAEYVRLVTDEGHGVVSRREALERARRQRLDLVEVQRHAQPPVCKLMDYHKEKYKQQIKDKDRSKGKSEMSLRKGDSKEVRIAGKIEQKDLQMKADMVKRLMERGYRVKCTAMNAEDDLGGLLSRLSALIEDVAIVESGPRVEKKQAYVVVRHVKFGPSKKGPGKKLSEAVQPTGNVQKVAVSPPSTSFSLQSPIPFEQNLDAKESGLVTDNEIISEEAPTSPSVELPGDDLEKEKSLWSVSDAGDEFDKIFAFGNAINGAANSCTKEPMKAAPELASLPANTSSEVMSTRPVLNSTRTPTVPSSPSETPLRPDNRYRKEPINRFPPTKSMDINVPGARDQTRLELQYSAQAKQPRFDLNSSTRTRETKQVEGEASMFGNLKLPADEFPNQEPSHPTSIKSPASSYGIFSAPKATDTSIKENVTTESNRYKKGSSSNSNRDPTPVGVSANPSSPTSRSDGSGRAGVGKGGQERWGRFSSENSNVIPSRNTEMEAKVQR